MNKKLYGLMDWAEIEAVTYSEADHPFSLLGPHPVGRDTVVQAFLPNAKQVTLIAERSKNPVPMELMDESGYFACLLRKKYPFKYELEVVDKDGKTDRIYDPYSFAQKITERAVKKFSSGHHYRAYDMLGAHLCEIDGVAGTLFSLWAPNALRVSVVGDFNSWDGRVHQMERIGDTGVFEIFIPGVKKGDLYKFEIKTREDRVILKSDPYAFESELPPGNASIVSDLTGFEWTDADWLDSRRKSNPEKKPFAAYEVDLGTFGRRDENGAFSDYKSLSKDIAEYMKSVGYTHLVLTPVMEYVEGPFGVKRTVGHFTPTKRYGSAEDFAWFVNHLHENGIGVILSMNISDFPKESTGLQVFDGTALYENENYMISCRPDTDTLKFDYAKPEVVSFMIASVLYWVESYHVDGVNLLDIAPMLYRDYCRSDGFIPNIYGGREDLEAVEFCKHLNSVLKSEEPGVIMIATDSSAWPGTTADAKENGLGFDYKWNLGWKNDFLSYLRLDPIYRTHHYGELLFSMVYAYSEKYLLGLEWSDFTEDKGSLLYQLPGSDEEKFSCIKAAFSYMFTYPGGKMLFEGQDIAVREAWRADGHTNFDYLKYDDHAQVNGCVKDLIGLYKERPALHALDHDPAGFEWINCISANENILVFMRKAKKEEDTLIVVVNFENIPRKNYKIGVPKAGKYKEIFNTDAEKYGGFDFRNSHVLKSEVDECDGRENSIRIKVPPLSVTVFEVQ